MLRSNEPYAGNAAEDCEAAVERIDNILDHLRHFFYLASYETSELAELKLLEDSLVLVDDVPFCKGYWYKCSDGK